MGEFSFGELIVIVVIAIVIYGKDLPQAARKLAAIYAKFKRQISDVRDEISRQIPSEELKIDAPHDPPLAPDGLVATPSPGQALLTWNPSIGASSYTLRRSAGPPDPWITLATSVAELSYTDTGLSPGKSYGYMISAVNANGESANSDEAIAVIPEAGKEDAITSP
jgi:Sec-independent protein translocase protein TatA